MSDKLDEKNCQVSFFDLQPTKKYIVTEIYKMVYYVGIFDNYQIGQQRCLDLACFRDLIEINPLIMKDKLLTKHFSIFSDHLPLLKHTFYDLKEIREKGKKARGNMERRAVNMIVRRLIGDDCFEW